MQAAAQVVVAATSSSNDDNPLQPVLDFFDSTTFRAVLQLTFFFFVALYLSPVFWTWKDAKRRIADPVLVAVSVATALVFPFLGVLIYVILRPPEYLDDVRERELEIRAMEERLTRRELHCPVCRTEVEPTFLVCPVCTTKLKQACASCKAPLDALWQVCPYCETPVDTPTAVRLDTWESEPLEETRPRRRARRRRE